MKKNFCRVLVALMVAGSLSADQTEKQPNIYLKQASTYWSSLKRGTTYYWNGSACSPEDKKVAKCTFFGLALLSTAGIVISVVWHMRKPAVKRVEKSTDKNVKISKKKDDEQSDEKKEAKPAYFVPKPMSDEQKKLEPFLHEGKSLKEIAGTLEKIKDFNYYYMQRDKDGKDVVGEHILGMAVRHFFDALITKSSITSHQDILDRLTVIQYMVKGGADPTMDLIPRTKDMVDKIRANTQTYQYSGQLGSVTDYAKGKFDEANGKLRKETVSSFASEIKSLKRFLKITS